MQHMIAWLQGMLQHAWQALPEQEAASPRTNYFSPRYDIPTYLRRGIKIPGL